MDVSKELRLSSNLNDCAPGKRRNVFFPRIKEAVR